MNTAIKKLDPKEVWSHFADLNAVPRPSKKEEKIIQFMVDFGKKLQLETTVDAIGNVIIRKPATTGMKDRKMVVLQGHLDMVHQKNSTTVFDFETQGIEMYIDGDWVKANGTTLGADNGLGVAAIMAVLSSKNLEHPAIEALFTIDEETGMTGAMELKPGVLQGEILLNLDTEEEEEIGIGCAGGVDITAIKEYLEEEISEDYLSFSINISGLNGGHSGMDIIKELGNANKIMNRILFDGFDNFGLRISEITGGSLRNAIPRESVANIAIQTVFKDAFLFETSQLINIIKSELSTKEPNLNIEINEISAIKKVVPIAVQKTSLQAIYGVINGVYRMSPDVDGLVETSNNIAKVTLKKGKITIECLTRSSLKSGKTDISNSIRAIFELGGFHVDFSGAYPGWNPNLESGILKILSRLYEEINQKKPHIAACHAGLECGILGQNYPAMDMISFGPNIKGAHSPDERVQISSTQKFWSFLVEILKNIPKK